MEARLKLFAVDSNILRHDKITGTSLLRCLSSKCFLYSSNGLIFVKSKRQFDRVIKAPQK